MKMPTKDLPYDADGKINPRGLARPIVQRLSVRVEQEHPAASDAEKWRLLQAEVLLYVYYSAPDSLAPDVRRELDKLAEESGDEPPR